MAPLPRSRGRFMRLALVASMLSCAPAPAPAPASAPAPAPARAPDLDARLTAIGSESADDRLAEAYVPLGPAALVHAARLARHDAEGDRARGARRVLFALRRPEDFAFLEAFPSPTRDADGACAAIDLSEYLRNSVEHMATDATAKVAKRPGARLPFVPAYASMLARIADEAWPTCTRTCSTCETSRSRPEVVAVTLLGEMTPSGDPPHLGDSDSTEEPPETEARFRAWWKAHRARLVAASTPPAPAAVAPLSPAARTGKAWPFHAFTRAEAVTFNEVAISPGYPLRAVDDQGTSPHITGRKSLSDADARTATDLVSATLGGVTVSKCAFPRHAVVLFDGEVPVASINVCFECGDILLWPPWTKDTSDAALAAREKRQQPLYEKAFPKWQAFFRDRVGFPVDRRYR